MDSSKEQATSKKRRGSMAANGAMDHVHDAQNYVSGSDLFKENHGYRGSPPTSPLG